MVLRVRLVEEIPVSFLGFFVSQAVPLEYCILKTHITWKLAVCTLRVLRETPTIQV